MRFGCTQCGACCKGGPDYMVWLEDDEPEKIREFLGISRSWLYRRYVLRLARNEKVLRSRPDGNCIFLDDEGRCSIYPVRPLQCASYPFWPEIVTSSKAWRREARRCEGIGRGEPVAAKKIEAIISMQQQKPDDSSSGQ